MKRILMTVGWSWVGFSRRRVTIARMLAMCDCYWRAMREATEKSRVALYIHDLKLSILARAQSGKVSCGILDHRRSYTSINR